MTKHYPLSPSAASRWLACPGSIDLERGLPDSESEFARHGTIAHELAAAALIDGINTVAAPRLCNRCNSEVFSPPCQRCGNYEYRIDSELIDAITVYVNFINDEIRATCDVLDEAIETTIESQEIPDLGGTIDYKAIYRDAGEGVVVGHIVDYKHGAGTPVSPENNAQLLTYALLAREQHPKIKHWRLTIVQPRCGIAEPETVEVSAAELDEHRQRIIDATLSMELQTGDHCRWCKAAVTCPARQDEAEEIVNAAIDGIDVKSVDLATLREHCERLLAAESRVKDFFDKLKARILDEMQRGVTFPGYKAVRSIGHRKWSLPEQQILTKLRSRKIGKKAATEMRLKSPAAMEREGHADAIKDLVTRSDLGYRLVPESAPGEPVIFESLDTYVDATNDNSDLL